MQGGPLLVTSRTYNPYKMVLWVPGGCNSKNITVGTLWEVQEAIPDSHPTYHLIWKKRLKSSNRIIFPFFLGVKMTKQVLKPPPSHQVTIWLVLLGILSTEYDQPYTREVQTPSSKKTSFTILYRKGLSPFKRSFTIDHKMAGNDFQGIRYIQ